MANMIYSLAQYCLKDFPRLWGRQFFGDIRSPLSDYTFNLTPKVRASCCLKYQSYRSHLNWYLSLLFFSQKAAYRVSICSKHKNPHLRWKTVETELTCLPLPSLTDRKYFSLSKNLLPCWLALITKWYILSPCLLTLPVLVHTAGILNFGFLSKANCFL